MKKLLACGLVALSAGAAIVLSHQDRAHAFFANQGMFLATGTAAAPAATLSASPPGPVTAGTSVVLTWTSNQSSCTGTQSSGSDFSTGGLANGTDSVIPTSPSTSYTVTCGTATPASTTVAVTGGGGGVACDQGPNAPSTPAPALAAGFTTCVLNADFTTTTTDPRNGINWSQTSTWLPECGLATPQQYTFRLIYEFGPNGSPAHPLAPCSRATIINDGGTNALDLVYTLADQSSYGNGTNGSSSAGRTVGLEFPTLWGSKPASTPAPFPFEYYWELTLRVPPASNVTNLSVGSGNGNLSLDMWNMGWNNPTGNPFQTSPDQMETNTKCTSPCTDIRLGWAVFWNPFNNTPPGGDTSNSGVGAVGPFYGTWDQYHTWGHLVTADTAQTTVSMCGYRDTFAAAIVCYWLTSNAGADPFFLTHEATLVIWVGDANCYGSPGAGCLINDNHVYLQSMRVWSCANYKTTTCPSATVIKSDAGSDTRFAWLDWIKKALSNLIPQAHADAFDPFNNHDNGGWICPDGKVNEYVWAPCMPPELRRTLEYGAKKWWEACVPGRTDCIWSETAFIGGAGYKAKRGPGFCYTQQPATCSPDPRAVKH